MAAKIDPFAALLTSRQNVKAQATAKAAVSVDTFTDAKGNTHKVFAFAPPDARPFNMGAIKVALVMGLSESAIAALDALPPALLDVTGPRARFIRAHRSEVLALLPQVS